MKKGASMFASGGIGEMYLEKAGVQILVANELLEKRAEFHKYIYPACDMVVGDIRNKEIKKKFISKITPEVKFLLATPPCQGLSNLGKNKDDISKQNDVRNYLIFEVLDVIKKCDFDYVLIENVPNFLKMKYAFKGENTTIIEILNILFGKKYCIESEVLNAKDYGVPQNRTRAIIKMHKKDKNWIWPKKEAEISLEKAIGHLPTLESGEKSKIEFHYARVHSNEHINWLKHTPTGQSAHDNLEYFPKKKNGDKIKGFKATYKRMKWDSPAAAITMRSDAISSQENVHPGRKNKDGTFSDARVLTLLELMIVSSLPEKWELPLTATDTFVRQLIGEAIPPRMLYKIVKGIK